MTYQQTQFNTRGRIPLTSDVWKGAIDEYVTSQGITPDFSKVIAEQTFVPKVAPTIPMYKAFQGDALASGEGWTERAINKRGVVKYNPKATPEDDLKFYESTGVEKTFTKNVTGRISVSLPSDLVSQEMMLQSGAVSTLNSRLLESVYDTYQMTMESAMETYAVTMTSHSMNVDTETDGILTSFQNIINKAADFMSDEAHYNDLTEEQNANLLTHSESVTLYLNVAYWNAYKNAKAVLPSPNELVENLKIVPMYNKLPAPMTEEQWNAGTVDVSGSVIAWEGEAPSSVGDVAPIGLLVDDRKFTYRPYKGSYRMNITRNGAGDFDNQHLIWNGSIASRPWWNAIRINDVHE